MYDRKPRKDWFSGAVAAFVGAGVVTTFAISQGQHPLMAFSITGFAVAASLMVDRLFFNQR